MFSKTRSESAESRPRRRFSYANVMSSVSVFMVLAGGTALAASLPANSVGSKTIKDNAVRTVDLKDGKAVARFSRSGVPMIAASWRARSPPGSGAADEIASG